MSGSVLRADFRLSFPAFDLAFQQEMDRETVVIFGPSGSGKSVALRAIAGLLRPEAGRIEVDGRTVFDRAAGVDMPAHDRATAWVPQDLGLFPHLTVLENVMFGMPGDRAGRLARARGLLSLTGIESLADRRPATISGGQAQRVALARAIARERPLLLLDEPFSALDEVIRESLRSELRRLCRELGRGAIFVTHDLREAYLLADRLVVMVNGRVLQSGSPEGPFLRPADRAVAELMGFRNLYRGRVLEVGPDSVTVDVAGRRWRCASWMERPEVGAAVDVGIRAERVALRRASEALLSSTNVLRGSALQDDAYGLNHLLRFRVSGEGAPLEVQVDLPARPYRVLDVARQPDWLLELAPADLHVMPVTDAPGD